MLLFSKLPGGCGLWSRLTNELAPSKKGHSVDGQEKKQAKEWELCKMPWCDNTKHWSAEWTSSETHAFTEPLLHV